MSKNKDTFRVLGDDVVKRLKELLHEGNVRRIILKDEKGKNTFLEIPVTIGVIGAVLAPILAVAGVLAVMVGAVTIEVLREEAKKSANAAKPGKAVKGKKQVASRRGKK